MLQVEGIVCDSSKEAVAKRSPGRLDRECDRRVGSKFRGHAGSCQPH